MIVIIGDQHLSDGPRPWSYKASVEQVKYISEHPLNTEDNTLILTGDIVDVARMSGTLYTLLFKYFASLKFKEVYIVVGNHDYYSYNNRVTLAYDFLRNPSLKQKYFKNFHVIDTMKVVDIEDCSVLMLPHIYPTIDKSNKDYEHLDAEITNREYDLCVTHLADSTVDSYPGYLLDLTAINATYWASGHIHAPSPHYVGSVVPNSSGEAQTKREFRTLTKKEGMKRVPIVNILDYYTVTFPDELPKTSAIVSVFTVLNCKDEATAKNQYGDIYIRKCVFNPEIDKDAFDTLGASLMNKEQFSVKELFDKWAKTTKHPESLVDLSRKYLVMGA